MPSLLLSSNSYAANSSDNTVFRAYGTAISNAFANAGWTHANDTGMVDWATVVANGTNGVWSGSDIWKMNDALAQTSPVAVKLDFGCTGTTSRPSIAITLGHSTNGTSGLIGVFSANTVLNYTAPSMLPLPCFFCGDTGRMSIAMWTTNATGFIISLERTHDANGADTAEGVLISLYGGSTWTQQYWNCKTGPAASEADVGVFVPANSLAGIANSFHWYPIYHSKGVFLEPSLNLIYGSAGHFSANCISTVTHYGASHNYVTYGALIPTNRAGISIGSFAISGRWE